MEIIKLIGVVIIVLGFALKLDVLAVVLVAGIVTGLVSGLDFFHILEIIGTSCLLYTSYVRTIPLTAQIFPDPVRYPFFLDFLQPHS